METPTNLPSSDMSIAFWLNTSSQPNTNEIFGIKENDSNWSSNSYY